MSLAKTWVIQSKREGVCENIWIFNFLTSNLPSISRRPSIFSKGNSTKNFSMYKSNCVHSRSPWLNKDKSDIFFFIFFLLGRFFFPRNNPKTVLFLFFWYPHCFRARVQLWTESEGGERKSAEYRKRGIQKARTCGGGRKEGGKARRTRLNFFLTEVVFCGLFWRPESGSFLGRNIVEFCGKLGIKLALQDDLNFRGKVFFKGLARILCALLWFSWETLR